MKFVSPASCYCPLLAPPFVPPFVSSCPNRWFRSVEMQGLARTAMCEVCEAQILTILFTSKFLTRRCDVPISSTSVIFVFLLPSNVSAHLCWWRGVKCRLLRRWADNWCQQAAGELTHVGVKCSLIRGPYSSVTPQTEMTLENIRRVHYLKLSEDERKWPAPATL